MARQGSSPAGEDAASCILEGEEALRDGDQGLGGGLASDLALEQVQNEVW